MSYNPTDRNASGIVFFGTAPTDQVFESNANFTIDGSALRASNIKIADSGNIGSDSYPSAISIDENGKVTLGGEIVVTGNLTVNGTQTSINTETLTVDDNIIVLNNNATGSPSQDAGVQVERGDSANVEIKWNETSDIWTFTNDGTAYHEFVSRTGVQALTNKTIDGGSNTLQNIPNSSLTNSSITLAGDVGSNQTVSLGDTLTIAGGTGISTSGNATDTVTVKLNDTAVTPGTYGNATTISSFTVDQQGRITAASGVAVSASPSFTLESVSGNTTISKDYTLVTAGAGGVTVTLPDNASAGTTRHVKKIDSGVGVVTISRQTADTIDGATSKVLYYQYESMSFVSDGSDWYVV